MAEPLTPEELARAITENWRFIYHPKGTARPTPLAVAKRLLATLDAARAAAPSPEPLEECIERIEQEAASKAVAEVLDRLEHRVRANYGTLPTGDRVCALIASEREP